MYSPFSFTCPWNLIQRWLWGFGYCHLDRVCSHTTPNPLMIIHFTWRFLTPEERLRSTLSHPTWLNYASLRLLACRNSVSGLQQVRAPPIPTVLDGERAITHSMALLRFNFIYGNFQRWLGHEYTNQHCQWRDEWNKLLNNRVRPLPSYYPIPDYNRAFQVQAEGAPLKAVFHTPDEEVFPRVVYNNHPAVTENWDKVMPKFAKEEHLSYHVHFLRFLHPFLYGLIVNPIQWAVDKGKGKICIDCSHGVIAKEEDPIGSANTYTPKPLVE